MLTIISKESPRIWIDGEGESAAADSERLRLWDSITAPEPEEGCIYYLVNDCPAIGAGAKSGTMWLYESGAWKEYTGEITAA